MAQDLGSPDGGQSPVNNYPYNQPWGSPKEKGSTATPAPKSEPANPPAQPTPPPPPAEPAAAVEAAAPTAPAVPSSDVVPPPAPALTKPVVAKNEVSVSADFFDGEGKVTIPIGYSLNKTLGNLASVPVSASSVSRSSQYFGGTVSYSYLHAWYVDVSYEDGTSSGNVPINAGALGNINSAFKIDDQWYQAYLRYTFPALRGKRLSAYLRAGASYVDATLKMNANTPEGKYDQNDKTKDILGNVGFGVGYSLYASRRWIISVQVEGEGFYGNRGQKSRETLSSDAGLTPKTANIDNTLYGGIGRGTVRFEYRLGQANRFRIFADGGGQGRFTQITYPRAGTANEQLYGPYVKVGLRYSF